MIVGFVEGSYDVGSLFHNLVHDALIHEAGGCEVSSVPVHQLEQVLTGLIDVGNVREIDQEWPLWMTFSGAVPASFQFANPGSSQPSLDLED